MTKLALEQFLSSMYSMILNVAVRNPAYSNIAKLVY